jgi:predicted nucleic acid-binding protein
MAYLLDTNVLSELRKGERAAPGVMSWFREVAVEEIFLSVLVIGEIRRGIELTRRKDPSTAYNLDRWLTGLLQQYESQILPVSAEIADRWGRLCLTQPLPSVDGLLAATALEHDLILATRNVRDIHRAGVQWLNPFETPSA